jgi:hypothetical protein
MPNEWVPGAQQSNVMRTLFVGDEPVLQITRSKRGWAISDMKGQVFRGGKPAPTREEAEFLAEEYVESMGLTVC